MFAIKQGVQCLRPICQLQCRTVTQLAGRTFLPDSKSKNFPKFLKEAPDDFPYEFKLNLKTIRKPELSKFGRSFRPLLDRMVDKYGVVVLRGFHIDGAIPFSEFFQALGYSIVQYCTGTGIRVELAKSVAAYRKDPPVCTVEPHSTMSFSPNFPHQVFLLNEVAPSRACGGDVVLVDSRDILQELDEGVVKRFKELGVRYYYHLPGGEDSVFPTWQKVMKTSDRAVVEKHLKNKGTQYTRWGDDESLTYWTNRPAISAHYRQGDPVWFNSIVNLHASHWKSHPKYLHINLPETHYPHTTLYGDGTPIEHDVLQHIREVTWRNAVGTKMHKGDIIVMDNMYVQHGRVSYTGERKVLISLARRDHDEYETDSDQ